MQVIGRTSALALLVGALAMCAADARAQARARYGSEVIRPTQSVSESLGGLYTRSRVNPLRNVSERDVALLGDSYRYRSTIRPNPFRIPRDVAALGIPNVGLTTNIVGPASQLFQRRIREQATARVITGYQNTFAHSLQLPGVGRRYVPSLWGQQVAVAAPRDAFQDYFGLSPRAPELADDATIDPLAERLERQTDERIALARSRGIEFFRAATKLERSSRTRRDAVAREQSELLVRAIQQLRLVSDLDDEAYVAPLLIAHARLEQDRPMAAVRNLLHAFRAKPDFMLVDQAELEQYFGDAEDAGTSSFLTEQMRRYARLAGLNDRSPEAHVLTAYCAWRLGLKDDARRAATAAETLARELAKPRHEPVAQLALAFQRAAAN
jgi:hypothetical protein